MEQPVPGVGKYMNLKKIEVKFKVAPQRHLKVKLRFVVTDKEPNEATDEVKPLFELELPVMEVLSPAEGGDYVRNPVSWDPNRLVVGLEYKPDWNVTVSLVSISEMRPSVSICKATFHYQNPDIPSLKGACNDLDLMKHWASYYGCADEDIKVLKNEEATGRAILTHLQTMCSEAARGDVLLFHFSGHGGARYEYVNRKGKWKVDPRQDAHNSHLHSFLCPQAFDVVAHTASYAILDALRPEWAEGLKSSPEGGVLHEAFADIVTILTQLSSPVVCGSVVAQTRCDPRAANVARRLQSSMADALGVCAMRSACSTLTALDVWDADGRARETTRSSREVSAMITSAVYSAVATAFSSMLWAPTHETDELAVWKAFVAAGEAVQRRAAGKSFADQRMWGAIAFEEPEEDTGEGCEESMRKFELSLEYVVECCRETPSLKLWRHVLEVINSNDN
eukprot:m51a1_g8587 hypothetical protein (451) ;mRNA; r:53851-59919